MNKVIIIGCPGSGKSTFARALHEASKLPVYHLDMLYWNSDKTIVEKPVFLERLHKAMEQDSWIIDGNYGATMELRFQLCDTVFFLDYPLSVCLEGIMERRGRERTDMPWIEPKDCVDEEFMGFIKNYNTDSRPKVMKLIEKYSDKDIYIFKSRGEADRYLAKIGDKDSMCIECYSDQNRITPLLNPIECLNNHTQYICGTCGRCICIEQDAKRGLQRWNFPFKSKEIAKLYLRTADYTMKHSCGIYEIISKNGRTSYKIFAGTDDLMLFLQKNKDKACESMKPVFIMEKYREYETTEVRRLTTEEVQKYMLAR